MSDNRIDISEGRQSLRSRPRPSRRPSTAITMTGSNPSNVTGTTTIPNGLATIASGTMTRLELLPPGLVTPIKNHPLVNRNEIEMTAPAKKLPIPGKRIIPWNLAPIDIVSSSRLMTLPKHRKIAVAMGAIPSSLNFPPTASVSTLSPLPQPVSPSSSLIQQNKFIARASPSPAVYSYAIVNQKLSHIGAFIPPRGTLSSGSSVAYRFIFTNAL